MIILSKQRGFTLFEVLTVIVIISIITCLSPVSSGFYTNSRYKTTVKKIVTDLRRFRMKAIYNNKTYNFRIYRGDDIYITDADSKSDYIFYYNDTNGNEIIVYHGKYPAQYTLYKNLNQVEITGEYYDRISFTGQGTACTGTIGLKNTEGKLTQIIVSQLGRIRVEK